MQGIADLAPKYLIEYFKESELLVDITEHVLVRDPGRFAAGVSNVAPPAQRVFIVFFPVHLWCCVAEWCRFPTTSC